MQKRAVPGTSPAPGKSRSPAKKSAASGKTVEAYLAAVPESSRATFDKLRAAVRQAVPKDAVETISYGIPAFRQDRVLVWFAAFHDHCSLFPTAAVIEAFRDELRDYSTSKGTIHFPLDRSLPAVLVKKLVRERVAQSRK